MRIKRIYMNGFGIHHDRLIELDEQAPSALFLGRNEAGKSTIMGFIRSMLFGFPTRAHMPDRYEPVSGGIHGGWLTVIDEHGREIRIERYEKNGSLKIAFPDGTEGGEAALHALLGGMTPDLFRNLFAFSLSELQKLDTLQTDEISSFLFSSGMGVGGGAILQAERKLAARLESLYKPRGSKSAINRLLREIEQAEGQLRQSKESSGQFNLLQDELQSVEQAIAATEQQFEQARSEREWLNKCVQSREAWLKMLAVQQQLDALPDVTNMPADIVVRYERHADEHQSKLLQLQSLQQKSADLARALEELTYDEALIAQRGLLEQLIERSRLHEENRRAEAEYAKELESGQAALDRTMRQIGGQYTLEQIRRFPLPVEHQETIASFAEQFATLRTRQAAAVSEHDRVMLHKAQVEQELQEARTERERLIANMRAAGLDGRTNFEKFAHDARRGWEEVRRAADDWRHARQRLSAAAGTEQAYKDAQKPEDRSRPSVFRWASLGLGLAAALTLGLVFSEYAAAAMAAIAGIIVFYMLTVRGAGDRSRQAGPFDALQRQLIRQRQEAERELDDARQKFSTESARLLDKFQAADAWSEAAASAAAKAAGDPNAVLAELASLMDEIDRAAEEWRQLQRNLEQADLRVKNAEQRFATWERDRMDSEAGMQSLLEESEALAARWQAWLQPFGIEGEPHPDTVMKLVEYANQALETADRLARTEAKLNAIRQLQSEFLEQAEQTIAPLAHHLPAASGDIAFRLRRLKEAADEHAAAREKQLALTDQAEGIAAELQQAKDSVERAAQAIESLLHEAGAEDESELRRRHQAFQEKSELLAVYRQAEAELFSWAPAHQQARLREMLDNLDADQIASRYEEAAKRERSLDEQLKQLRVKKGELQGELKRIRGGDDHASLLQTHQEKIAEFRHSAEEWMKLALCAELIRKAKEMYERDKQPGVLQRASVYFATITEGQYSRVVSRFGEKSLFAERPDGERIDSAFLSRGTAEQLYLCMRFALADEYSSTVNMPIFMDDIFVNFDRERLDRALSVLAEVAQRRQVLLFTCHEHIAAAVAAAMPDAQQIVLNPA